MAQHDAAFLSRFPLDRYLDPLTQAPARSGYKWIPPGTQAMAQAIAAEGGEAALAEYHRLVIRALLDAAPPRIEAARLPPSVRALLDIEFARIDRELREHDDAFYRLSNDLFLKDLGLALLRLLPCGAELVQVDAGIPRSLLFRGGARQALRACAFFALRARAFHPFYALHMDPRRTSDFSPDGWNRTYLRIADLLRMHPEVRGLVGTAWFYDPALREISPRLAYLREQREMHGACNFRSGAHPDATAAALARSPTRQRLYAEGRYVPSGHYLVWLRADLLRWADAHRDRIAMIDAYATDDRRGAPATAQG